MKTRGAAGAEAVGAGAAGAAAAGGVCTGVGAGVPGVALVWAQAAVAPTATKTQPAINLRIIISIAFPSRIGSCRRGTRRFDHGPAALNRRWIRRSKSPRSRRAPTSRSCRKRHPPYSSPPRKGPGRHQRRSSSAAMTSAPPAICGFDGSKPCAASRFATIARASAKAVTSESSWRSAWLNSASPK